ncbi:putative membrane protein YeaQ/YmgE (transglycosylase-associated protein family) [Luteibacter sp. 621]|uniref:hypothetical protein n=1 Tax=Luteibacter sp. 621 TaxID=3373916 RepID=UPI003D1E8E46
MDKTHHPDARTLRAVLAALPAHLSAIGSSLVGATVFLLISGATYYQALLEALHAGWAVDTIPYTAMVRAGALNALTFLLTTSITVALTLGSIFTRREMVRFFWGSMAILAVGTILTSLVPPLRAGYWGQLANVITTVAGAYLVATALTALLALKPRTRAQQRGFIIAGAVVVLGLLIYWPFHVGKTDASQILSGENRSKHPDVCIKGDPVHAWRLVRAVEDRYLVISPEPGVTRLRLVPMGDVTDLLTSLPGQPAEGGPPALACRPPG